MAQNIDDFNRYVALILAYLYQRFPVPAVLNVADLVTHDGETEREDDRYRVYAAIDFLFDEGYLRYVKGELGSDALVLTNKTLAALQKTWFMPDAMFAPRQAIRIILG